MQMIDFYGSEAHMMPSKQLDSLRSSASEQLGIPIAPPECEDDMEAVQAVESTAVGSPSQPFSITSGDMTVAEYDQMFEADVKEDSATKRKITYMSSKLQYTYTETGASISPLSTSTTPYIPPAPSEDDTGSIAPDSTTYTNESPFIPPPPPPEDTPGSTFGFGDLPSMFRERAPSLSEDSYTGSDQKKQRLN
jgi:hypothetical protein